ncbi:hypothetical protein KEM48_011043 [Puccinia striiformis f. sp. tritici PST-130]|nr:hypothetical protein KEM48_011043 [Puccinia striiformis f. sp. tritici PST-130]
MDVLWLSARKCSTTQGPESLSALLALKKYTYLRQVTWPTRLRLGGPLLTNPAGSQRKVPNSQDEEGSLFCRSCGERYGAHESTRGKSRKSDTAGTNHNKPKSYRTQGTIGNTEPTQSIRTESAGNSIIQLSRSNLR